LLEGACQETVACRLPAVAVTVVGAPGTVAGTPESAPPLEPPFEVLSPGRLGVSESPQAVVTSRVSALSARILGRDMLYLPGGGRERMPNEQCSARRGPSTLSYGQSYEVGTRRGFTRGA